MSGRRKGFDDIPGVVSARQRRDELLDVRGGRTIVHHRRKAEELFKRLECEGYIPPPPPYEDEATEFERWRYQGVIECRKEWTRRCLDRCLPEEIDDE